MPNTVHTVGRKQRSRVTPCSREGGKIAGAVVARGTNARGERPIEIECHARKPPGGFADNSTCTTSRPEPLYRDTIPGAALTGAALSTIRATRFCRRGDGCLCRRSSVFALLIPLSLSLSSPLAVRRRDSWKKWMDHFVLLPVLFYFIAHRRRVNRTPRRILPAFRRHFVNVRHGRAGDEQRAQVGARAASRR